MALTDAQYAAFIDRLIACREELRMTEKDRTKANFRNAAVEDGRDRYRRGKASHVRAREADHSPDAGNMVPEHDAETGEIIEPQSGLRADTAAQTVQPHADAVLPEVPAGSVESGAGEDGDDKAVLAPIQEPQADGNARQPAQTVPDMHPVQATPAEAVAVEASAAIPSSKADTGAAGLIPTDAPLSEAAAREDAGAAAPELNSPSVTTAPQAPQVTDKASRSSVPSSIAVPAAPHLPGEVWTERAPPEPVRRHDYGRCFPEHWGMSLAGIKDSIREEGVREPIVKIGNEILDGWARYTSARELLIDYPVTEYAGTDPLIDVIRWNLEARQLGANERKLVATKLAKLCPDRGEEIAAVFGLDHGREAAE